jgi:acetyltransferase-like isoleucine patch superfamily enzyme
MCGFRGEVSEGVRKKAVRPKTRPFNLILGRRIAETLQSVKIKIIDRQPDGGRMGNVKRLNCGIVDVNFGENVTVIEPVNLYGCKLDDDVFVGPFVEIQRDVVVGKRTRIQSHAFICELVTIGDDCFISHGAMFINDLFQDGGPSPSGRRDLWKSTTIGNDVSIGTNSTILPVTICDDVVIGAGSVVTKDITEPGVYAGNPARLLRKL